MLKRYLDKRFLYAIIFISMVLNTYLLYMFTIFYDEEYYTEVLFNESRAGFVTHVQCQ